MPCWHTQADLLFDKQTFLKESMHVDVAIQKAYLFCFQNVPQHSSLYRVGHKGAYT